VYSGGAKMFYEEKLISILNRTITIETFDSMYIFGVVTGFVYSDMTIKENETKELYPVITEIELNRDPELKVKVTSIKELTLTP
jgi:hypothetical protein